MKPKREPKRAATAAADLPAVFRALRAVMEPYARKLDLKTGSASDFYVDTRHILKNKKPLFFGAVQLKKNYVSYHLMPLYVDPQLLEGISEGLKSRMQGKSCFNFARTDRALFRELAALTKAGYARYREEGFV